MAFKWAVGSLGKSVLVGGATAASVAAVIAAAMVGPFVGDWHDAAQVARLVTGVAAISFAIVLVAALLVGLPTTYVLRRLRKESETAYVVAGAGFGFVLPLVALFLGDASGGYWIAMLGAVSGGVAGWVWWRTYRLEAAEAD